MKYKSDYIVRAIKFWRRNKRKILIILIAILIVFLINTILKNRPKQEDTPKTTYTPQKYVMNNNKEVDEKVHEKVEDIIEEYFNYCNSGDYESAYNLITEDCKKNNYPTLESFKGYINEVFEGKKKIYNIQSYSNVDNKYIYNVRILDDILANGTTDGYYYYEEKFVLTDENGEMKLSIAEYVEEKEPNIIVEDEYIRIKILKKVTDYSSETYTVQVDNKTDNYIVLYDGTQANEIKMNYNGTERAIQNNIANMVIRPNSFTVRELNFRNYYDDGQKATNLKFGAVRVLKSYDVSKGTTQEDLDSAIKLYSIEVPVQ